MLCIVQARLGSTRLPGKSFMDLAGKPLITHVIDRVCQIPSVRDLVLAVPWSDVPAFQVLPVRAMGFPDVDDMDVLGRFAMVREQYPNAHTIMRICGDCPLLNPQIAEQVVQLYHADPHVEYAWNVAPGYVDGEDVEVFSSSALKWAHREATDPSDREHVGPWLRRHVKTATLLPAENRGYLKTSIDTVADLERVREILEAA